MSDLVERMTAYTLLDGPCYCGSTKGHVGWLECVLNRPETIQPSVAEDIPRCGHVDCGMSLLAVPSGGCGDPDRACPIHTEWPHGIDQSLLPPEHQWIPYVPHPQPQDDSTSDPISAVRERDIDRLLLDHAGISRQAALTWLRCNVYNDAAKHRRWNAEGMPEDTPAQRVYKQLAFAQLFFQEAEDEEAHDLLCDAVLDEFHKRYGDELR